MIRISLDTLIAKDTTKVIDRVVEGETLVIHLPSGNYFSLNAVGTEIWENIDGVRKPRDLAEMVATVYDVDVKRAQADVLNLISDLANEGLVIVPVPHEP